MRTEDRVHIPILRLPSGETVTLDRPITIGRSSDNDVVLSDPAISRYHCSIAPDDGQILLLDRKSTSGTMVNNQRIGTKPIVLSDGDRIRLGNVELEVQLPAVPAPASTQVLTPISASEGTRMMPAVPPPNAVVSIQPVKPLYLRRGPGAPRILAWDLSRPFTVGRSSDSDLSVADDTLSRHHAEFQSREGRVFVHDMGSANRTIVNGERLATARELHPGDVVIAGPLELVYDPPLAEPGAATLVVQGSSRHIALDREVSRIGRSPDCDVVLKDDSVSQVHAEIRSFGWDHWLVPLADRTIRVNNGEITGATLLRSGDVIQLGEVRLTFRAEAARIQERSARAPKSVTLREAAPFAEMDQAAFDALLRAGDEVTFGVGTVIINQEKGKKKKKDKNPSFYVILSGEAKVCGPVANDWENVAVVTRLMPGDFCGERTIVYGQTYPYQVEAVSAVRAFRLQQKDYEKLVRGTPAIAGFFKDKVARNGLVKYLRQIPLLAGLTPEQLRKLAGQMPLKTFPAGDVLVRATEPVHQLFVVASGSFKVDSVQRGALTTLTNLSEGKYVGEQVAADEPSPYTVVAETPGEAYVLTHDQYLALTVEYSDAFDFGASGLPASVVLEHTPPFDTLAPEFVAEAARELRVKYFRAGETIIYQNDAVGSAFYIIARGEVDVLFRTTEGQERVVNHLKAGQCFGEGALVTNSPRNATVKATEDCELLTLYRREFNEIVSKAPMILGPYLGHTFNSRFRPKHIDDVEIFEQHDPSGVSYIIKNNVRNTYVSLSEQGLFIWNLLDGQHTMNDIAAAYFQKFKSLAMGVMFSTIQQLQQLGFLDVSIEELMQLVRGSFKPTPMQRAMMFAGKIMTAKKEFKNADAHFRAIYNWGGRLFFLKPVLLLMAIINIAGLAMFLHILATGDQLGSIKFTGWGILLLVFFDFFVVTTHEMGHGVTMIHIGRKVLGAGIGVQYMSPMAFVNTTDAWLATQRQRIAVTAGGLIITLTEAAIATLLLPVVHQPFARLALAEFAFMGYFGFLYNIAPVLPTDGYNLTMDILQIPDLRPRAFHYIFSGKIFTQFRKRPWTREQKAFMVFGLIVFLFMILMGFNAAFSIIRLIGPTLRAHLPAVAAVGVQVLMICMMLGMFLLSMLKEAKVGERKGA